MFEDTNSQVKKKELAWHLVEYKKKARNKNKRRPTDPFDNARKYKNKHPITEIKRGL